MVVAAVLGGRESEPAVRREVVDDLARVLSELAAE